MELKILEETKNKLIFELVGEDHTFCNALKQELTESDDVKIASYKIEHPLRNVPQFIVETAGKDPRKAVADAAKRLQANLEKFRKSF